jgi:hypothetical protein
MFLGIVKKTKGFVLFLFLFLFFSRSKLF